VAPNLRWRCVDTSGKALHPPVYSHSSVMATPY